MQRIERMNRPSAFVYVYIFAGLFVEKIAHYRGAAPLHRRAAALSPVRESERARGEAPFAAEKDVNADAREWGA